MVSRADKNPQAILNELLQEQSETLLLQEAAAHSDFADEPEVQEAVGAYEDSMLVIAYLQDMVEPQVVVTPDEVHTRYEGQKLDYREPSRYKVATLTRNTLDEAEDDLQAIQSGTDFGWLARRHSTDEASKNGGERPELPAGALPSGAKSILDTLSIGSVTPPIPIESGYVLIRLIDRRLGDPRPFSRVASQIQAQIQREKELEAIDSTIKLLRASSEIHIQDDVINHLRITARSE